MTISQGSRYVAANLVNTDASSDALPNRGSNITIYTPPVIFRNAPYRRYQVVQGDSYPKIANSVLGTSADWWRIADMNPQIFFPDDLVPGTLIRVPVS